MSWSHSRRPRTRVRAVLQAVKMCRKCVLSLEEDRFFCSPLALVTKHEGFEGSYAHWSVPWAHLYLYYQSINLGRDLDERPLCRQLIWAIMRSWRGEGRRWVRRAFSSFGTIFFLSEVWVLHGSLMGLLRWLCGRLLMKKPMGTSANYVWTKGKERRSALRKKESSFK